MSGHRVPDSHPRSTGRSWRMASNASSHSPLRERMCGSGCPSTSACMEPNSLRMSGQEGLFRAVMDVLTLLTGSKSEPTPLSPQIHGSGTLLLPDGNVTDDAPPRY